METLGDAIQATQAVLRAIKEAKREEEEEEEGKGEGEEDRASFALESTRETARIRERC